MAKYLVRGDIYGYKEEKGLQVSTGAASAGRLIEANPQGQLDATYLPPGIGADVAVLPASEALAAGDFVSIWIDTGVAKVRKAVNDQFKQARGFVLANVTVNSNATVYINGGINNLLTGLNPGTTYFLSGTAGQAATTITASADGKIHQELGVAISATAIAFEYQTPIQLAT